MYLDPGLGSILIQAIIASIAAVAVGFGLFRAKIMGIFKKNKQSDDEAADESTDGDTDESIGEDNDADTDNNDSADEQ